MTIIQSRRLYQRPNSTLRFSDAKDVETLTRLLDEHFTIQGGNDDIENALHPQEAWIADPIQYGKLVQTVRSGAVRRADASSEIPATGVVVKVLSAGRVIYSVDALVEIKLVGTPNTPDADLYLGENGVISISYPTAPGGGLVQRVGYISYRNGASDTYVVRIAPGMLKGFSI